MLAWVMDILIDISSRLDVQEKVMEELMAAREEAPGRVQVHPLPGNPHAVAEDAAVNEPNVILLLISLLHPA